MGGRSGGEKALLILLGLIGVIAGLLAITSPGLAAVALTWILGIWLIVRGAFEVFAAFSASRDAPRWLLLVTAVTALVARPRIDWIRRRTLRWLYWSAAALVVLLFTATLAAAQLSQYRILLSATTFVICAAILYLEPLFRLARASRPALRATAPRVEPCRQARPISR